MSYSTKTIIFGTVLFKSFWQLFGKIHSTKTERRRVPFSAIFPIFLLLCYIAFVYLIIHFFIFLKSPLVQNKIAATALGSGSRDIALVCIERPSITLHHQMQKWPTVNNFTIYKLNISNGWQNICFIVLSENVIRV